MDEPWTLAIDFGTSYTVAAIRVDDRKPEVIEIAGERRVPSVIFADDDGRVIVGRAADDLALSHPDRAIRASKSRLGDPSPIVLGGRPHRAIDLVAALLMHVYAEALRYQGSAPLEVRLTHPATWSRPRLKCLLEAAAIARLPSPVLIPEPVAAAVTYADEVGMRAGGHVAVYDLGGGTFDTAALRSDHDGFVVVGRPSGDASMGGELFDELLANHAGERLAPDVWERLQVSDDPMWQRASANLHTEARRVKELLSSHPYADMLIGLPDGLVQQRVTHDELDTLIGPYVHESVDVLARCVADAGLTPSRLDAIYLVGGSSRSPLVERLVAERFPGVRVSRRGDPKTSVALGATRVTSATSLEGALAAAPSTTLDPPPATSTTSTVPTTLAPPPATSMTSTVPTVVERAGSTVYEDAPSPSTGAGTVRANDPTRQLPTFAPPPPPAPPGAARGRGSRRPVALVAVGAVAAAVVITAVALATRGKSSTTATTLTPTASTQIANQQLGASEATARTTATTLPATTASATTVAVTTTAAPTTTTAAPAPTTTLAPATTIGGATIVPPPGSDPLSANVLATFTAYFSGINDGDYERARLRTAPARRATADAWAASLATTHDSDIVVHAVAPSGGGAATAWVTFTSVQAPEKGPRPGETCTRWSIDYQLVPADDGLLWLDGAVAHPGDDISQACS